MASNDKKSTRLSVVIPAHNEAAQISACLKSVAFADEVIVVADNCTDETVKLARENGAKVIEGAWEIEGPRRHAALDVVTGDWVLEVDADERATPELGKEIRDVMASSKATWHSVPVDNYVGETLVRNGWGASFGVRSAPRLFRAGQKTWGPQRLHPKVTFAGPMGPKLQHALIHYVDENLSDMFSRLNRYSDLRARDLREKGIRESLGRNIRRFFTRFFKCYVSRKGYSEGLYGFTIALCAALYPLLSFLKAKLDK